MDRYPEKALQLAAIDWLGRHRGYVGHFSDEEGRGARMDAAGLMGDRLVLIEAKVRIDAGLVGAASGGAGALECKVAAALAGLHGGADDPLSTVARRLWDRRHPPLVALLAAHWSADALRDLVAVFDRRAAAWRFDWVFWRWTGTRVETIGEGGAGIAGAPADAPIAIPDLRPGTSRAANRTIDDLRGLAAERGVAELFEAFLAAARTAGYRLKPARTSVTAQAREIPGHRRAAVFATYLAASTPGRLAVGCWSEILARPPEDLPGEPSPRPFGYLNDDRFLARPQEVADLLAVPLRTVGRGEDGIEAGSHRPVDAPPPAVL